MDKWNNPMPIKVLLNSRIAEDLCPDSTCGSINDIRCTLEAAMFEYFDLTGGELHFVYVGETNASPGTVIADHIHIFANPGPGSTLAVAAWDDTRTWGKIRICNTNAGGPIVWDTFHPSSDKRSLHSVLLHELGHVIGMEHAEQNPSGPPYPTSIMHAGVSSLVSEHLQGPDISFVSNTYGVRSNRVVPVWTPDGVTWADGGGGPWPAPIRTYGRLAATNSLSSGNDVYLAWNRGNIYVSRYTPSSWTLRSVIFLDSGVPSPIYHPGIASKGNEVLLAYLGNRNPISGLQDVVIVRSYDGGLTWDNPVVVSTSPTANAGVSASYDPVSDSFVVVWRGSIGTQRNSILYNAVDRSPTVWKLEHPVSGTDIKAADTPSIACGPANGVGEDNILLAWADAFHWQRPIRWSQGRMGASGELEFQAARTHGFVSVGSASVAYWGVGDYPWILALNQGGNTTFTWRKRATHAQSFVDERSIGYPRKVGLPTAASRRRSERDGRGYVFRLQQQDATQRMIEKVEE